MSSGYRLCQGATRPCILRLVDTQDTGSVMANSSPDRREIRNLQRKLRKCKSHTSANFPANLRTKGVAECTLWRNHQPCIDTHHINQCPCRNATGERMSTSMSVSSAPASGMRDFLPAEVALRDWATAKLIETYQSFGFTRIETPALENILQLRRGEGGENLQLIFEVLKRGDKLDKVLSESPVDRQELADLGLRFDLTVPLVRFYAHNQGTLPNPFKAIQIGSVWRAESPQVGRYRQFTQCDIDTIGVKSEIAEMELIEATAEALLSLGFEDFTVRLNDRRILTSLAEACGFESDRHDNLFIQIDKLEKIGIDGVERELRAHQHTPSAVEKLLKHLERFSNSKEITGDIETVAPENSDKEVLAQLKNVLAAIGNISKSKYRIVFDPTLVRGMGYYTGQIFEITTRGASASIAGGGRYDKMVGKMSGRDVPACGFSIGFERIISILGEQKLGLNDKREKLAVIYDVDRDDMEKVLEATKVERDRGMVVSLLPRKKEMKKQLDGLQAEGFTAFAVFKADTGKLDIKPLG
jgi:histidyl-tRNA synthetase